MSRPVKELASCSCRTCGMEDVPGVRWHDATFCELCWYLGLGDNQHVDHMARSTETGRLSRLMRRLLVEVEAPVRDAEAHLALHEARQKADDAVSEWQERARVWEERAMWLAYLHENLLATSTHTQARPPLHWRVFWESIDGTLRAPQARAQLLQHWAEAMATRETP